MLPYFFKFNKKFLTSEVEELLIKIALSNTDNFISYKGKLSNEYDGNNIYSKNLMFIPEIRSLVSGFPVRCRPMLLMHKPNASIIKHVDDSGHHRKCVIINPLHPKTNYAPTLFWNNTDINKLEVICDSDMMPVLFNTQKLHSWQNNNNIRLNFQLCFDSTFEEGLSILVE